jgi:hypothetical protein
MLYSRPSTLTETNHEREHLQDEVVIERYQDCQLVVVESHNISIHKSNSNTFQVSVNININCNTYNYYYH